MRGLFCFLILVAFAVSITEAIFELHLKDGQRIRVSKITFQGSKVEVYPIGGAKQIISEDQIDYDATGIKRPDAAMGATIYGSSKAIKSADTFSTKGTQKSSQEDLATLWNKATRTAIAVQEYGTIRKGETVRIVWNDVSLFKVLSKDSEGNFNMSLIDGTTFFETFKSEEEVRAYEERFGPYKVKDIPLSASQASEPFVETKEEEEPEKEDTLFDTLRRYPLGIGIAGVIIVILILKLFGGRK